MRWSSARRLESGLALRPALFSRGRPCRRPLVRWSAGCCSQARCWLRTRSIISRRSSRSSLNAAAPAMGAGAGEFVAARHGLGRSPGRGSGTGDRAGQEPGEPADQGRDRRRRLADAARRRRRSPLQPKKSPSWPPGSTKAPKPLMKRRRPTRASTGRSYRRSKRLFRKSPALNTQSMHFWPSITNNLA